MAARCVHLHSMKQCKTSNAQRDMPGWSGFVFARSVVWARAEDTCDGKASRPDVCLYMTPWLTSARLGMRVVLHLHGPRRTISEVYPTCLAASAATAGAERFPSLVSSRPLLPEWFLGQFLPGTTTLRDVMHTYARTPDNFYELSC